MAKRNPVVQDQLKNPNRSNKVHGDKLKNLVDKLKTKEGYDEFSRPSNTHCGGRGWQTICFQH